MTERLQFTFVCAGLPWLFLFGFVFELQESGYLPYAIGIAGLLSVIIGLIAYRAGRVFDRL